MLLAQRTEIPNVHADAVRPQEQGVETQSHRLLAETEDPAASNAAGPGPQRSAGWLALRTSASVEQFQYSKGLSLSVNYSNTGLK